MRLREGQQFVIVSNGGVDPVQGIFKNLANNAIVEASNGLKLRVNYNSAPGNDTLLTVTQLALNEDVVRVGGGDLDGSPDVNECNQLTVFLLNSSLGPVSGIETHLRSPNPEVLITQGNSTYPNIPALARRARPRPQADRA